MIRMEAGGIHDIADPKQLKDVAYTRRQTFRQGSPARWCSQQQGTITPQSQ
jgi:hypothetical protein